MVITRTLRVNFECSECAIPKVPYLHSGECRYSTFGCYSAVHWMSHDPIWTNQITEHSWKLYKYAYWVCAARETPIFSPEYPFGAYSFHQKNPFRIITILNILVDFAVPETIIFKISLISTRSSPPTAGSARTQSVRQRRGLAAGQSASQTRPGSSGDSHFHAQNGSSSFLSPVFSSSKRLNLVPEPRIFTLDRELVHQNDLVALNLDWSSPLIFLSNIQISLIAHWKWIQAWNWLLHVVFHICVKVPSI